MKKVALILALIFGVLIFNSSKIYKSGNTSPKTRLDSLMSKKWRYELDIYHKTEIYTKDVITSKGNRMYGSLFTRHYAYYLTDDVANLGFTEESLLENFDRAKVGKSTTGKYLVTVLLENQKYTLNGYIYEIMELSDTTLVLRYIHSNGQWSARPAVFYKAQPLD